MELKIVREGKKYIVKIPKSEIECESLDAATELVTLIIGK